jgi:hypothetical protein
VRETVAEFGFTAENIFSKRHRNAGLPVAPKYRNPETGETWSGRGRAPALAQGSGPRTLPHHWMSVVGVSSVRGSRLAAPSLDRRGDTFIALYGSGRTEQWLVSEEQVSS